ncbi:DNA polymerase I [bacterium]|nr:DNA polymerase I [bacterium]
MATLLLVDGHSQAYRAYFGVKAPLMTRTGELTTAVYGFTRKLLSLLREYKPEYVAVAFDKGDTWRHADFPEYKATRDQMPDDLRSQITRIEEVLGAFNIPIVTATNYEADDVLGTLARKAAAEGVDVLILTGDRDMFQLIDERVKILYTRGGPSPSTDVYGPAELRERYDGLTPAQFIDMKALVGDTSDNIPGVAGVGEKTAIKFLQSYGDLDGLYAHIDEVRGPKTQESLREAQEQIRRNRKLVEIVTDLELAFDADTFRLSDYNVEAIREIFEALEFRTMLREINLVDVPDNTDDGQLALFADPDAGPTPTVDNHPYRCVKTSAELAEVVALLKTAEIVSFDVETTAKDPMQAALVGFGVAWDKAGGAYIPVGHAQGDQLPWDEVRAALQPIFADAGVPKVAHNIKYDTIVCRRHGLEVAGPLHDTMTLAFLIDPASRVLDLKGLAGRELNWQMTEISSLIGSGRKQITIDQVAIEQVTAYCGADVDATIHLWHLLKPRVEAEGMWDLYEQIELPLVPVLIDMEMAGITLDTAFLAQMSTELVNRLAEIEKQLFQIVGHEFNLRSTQQLSDVLFNEMGFPTGGMKKTQSGFYSTAVAELEKLAGQQLSADQRSLIDLIFEQRQLEKLRGTYVDALPLLVNPETGRLHTSFNQTGAATGRLSSSDPNLQNIPIRTEIGREIRKGFVAPPGWALIAADYSQVELRILAHVTEEPGLLEAFRAGLDIHAATAARLFGVDLDNVDRNQRALAKMINFATIYGVSAYGLSSRTEMDPREAQRFLDQYFATYPRVQRYITETLISVKEKGYVETLLGRKRYFPELLEGANVRFMQRHGFERAAINAPIQGTAADIIKIAMSHLHARLRREGFQARMLLQVHDELVLEAPAAEIKEVVRLVTEEMETAYTMQAPLRVDVETGPNWYDMEEV